MLTSNELVQGTSVEFGVSVASDGTVSRVAAGDASSVATISGNYHSEHGLTGMKVVVHVEGNVTILVGQCTYSGNEIKVTNSAGETVASKTPATVCWKNDHNNVTELTYAGEATTLTISGMGYCPFIAVKALNEVIKKYAVSYSLGSETAQGILPTGGEIVDGESITIPANFTLYKEGYTLTGWTDGSKNYAAGETVTPKGDLALTPVFTANTVNLADRTAEVTLKWDFQRKNGAPTIQWQNVAGLVWWCPHYSVAECGRPCMGGSGRSERQDHRRGSALLYQSRQVQQHWLERLVPAEPRHNIPGALVQGCHHLY